MAEEFSEFEVKVLSIDLAAIRAKLLEIGHLDRHATIDDVFYENPFTSVSDIDVRLRSTQVGCQYPEKKSQKKAYGPGLGRQFQGGKRETCNGRAA